MYRLLKKSLTFFFLILARIQLSATDWPFSDEESNLMNDLLIVDYWNHKLNDRMPVTYNHLLQGGYFSMPSARMGCEGEIALGYSYVPPYRNYNLRCQINDWLELTGNYRVFHGIEDPVLSPLGFGDFSDKGANFKFALFRAEDSGYQLPGLAFGIEDFMGTQAFRANYVVLTQVFLDYNMEVTLGYGSHRIKGLFGGISWMPFRQTCYSYLQGLSLAAEYDAIPYKDENIEKHPHGRKKKSPINFGIKYRLWDNFDFSLAYIRGHALACSASVYYNFGDMNGFLPKIDDPLPYTAPMNVEPLGFRRPEGAMVQDLAYAFQDQGIELLEIRLGYTDCYEKRLRLRIYNETFRLENDVRCRLNSLLANIIPNDIAQVDVVIDSEGFPIQEYHFCMDYVRHYKAGNMGDYELKILSPLCEASFPDPCSSQVLFHRKFDWWNFELSPKTHTFFGSSSGKFKYSLGVHAGLNGFLWNDVYYSLLLGYTFFSDLYTLKEVDILNPSQIINVRTDVVRYYKQKGITVDEAYLQKNWNMGKGWYSRVAAGYFEEEYAGLASEFLYFPINSPWAVGIEGAIFKKRTSSGLGFTSKIRKYKGFFLTHKSFPYGSQYFLNLYYDWQYGKLEFKVSAGKFLANDYGVRYEVSRYFASGMRISIWYTYTNGHDKINGQTYYDKGVYFSMPFDIFYTYSERSRWGYGMSAWLRDVGVQACTGWDLYNMIRDHRE